MENLIFALFYLNRLDLSVSIYITNPTPLFLSSAS